MRPAHARSFAKTVLARIQRYRDGKTPLPGLILKVHVFVEAYDADSPSWVRRFRTAWATLVRCAGPSLEDPSKEDAVDRKAVEVSLRRIEALLRDL